MPDKIVDEIKTHYLFNNCYPENLCFCEIIWKSIMVEPGRFR